MKNTEMLEWMNDLDAKYLTEAAQPVIRQHKKRRLMPALIAAAAAVAVMTAGVGAYMTYNKQMVQFGFGTLGEARMAELVAPEPVTYDNGIMSVTIENVLSDGVQAMILMTVEPVDKDADFVFPDMDPENFSFSDFMRNEFVIGDSMSDSICYSEFSCDPDYPEILEAQNAAGQRWYKVFYTLPEDASEDDLANAHFNFEKVVVETEEKTFVHGELFEGISIPVDLRQNVDALQMQSEDGRELTLSPFELYEVGYMSDNNDWWNMYITWKNGETQRITYTGIAGSDGGYGRPEITWGEFAVPTNDEIDSESVTGSINFNGPEDWCGFIDVNDVAAFQFGDTVFYPVE